MRKDWEVKNFEDVFFLKMGKTPSRDNSCYWNGDYKWASISDINDCKYIYNTKEKISSEAISDNNMTLIPEGTVIMSFKLSIGKVAIAGENMYSNEAIMAFIPKFNNVISDYIYYYIKGHQWIGGNKAVMGITLNKKSLSKNKFLIPPLQTQQQIVEELDSLTSIIEKQKKQLEELDNLAQSIFYDMFGDPVENEREWNVKNLDEVCDVRDGTHDSPKYLLYSDYVLITSKNIANGKLDFTNVNYISKSDFDKINLRSKVDKGDILMAMIGTIGNPIIVNSDNINFCIKNMALIKLIPNSLVHRLYLHSLLSSKSFDELVKRINKGGTQKFIALGTIRKLIIPLPPLSLQQEFASKIEAIEKQKELIKKSIKETEDLFNSRMDYYFN